MKIAITGPTGTIGMALIEFCMENKIEVLAICRRGSPGISMIPKNPLIRIEELNMDEYGTIEIEGNCSVFYHFAWSDTFGSGRNDIDIQYKNIKYTLDSIRLAEKLRCHTFIGAGSQAEFGRVEGVLSANTPTRPETGYGIAKLSAGLLSRLRCEQLGIKHIWARVLSVYGPYDDERTMVASTLRKLSNKAPLSFTAGEQVWDFLYSKDAAKILYELSVKGKDGGIYCIGSGKARMLRMFIEEMRDIVDTDRQLTFGEIPYALNQVMHLSADISDLQKDLGGLTLTPFKQGIKETLQHIQNTP